MQLVTLQTAAVDFLTGETIKTEQRTSTESGRMAVRTNQLRWAQGQGKWSNDIDVGFILNVCVHSHMHVYMRVCGSVCAYIRQNV